MKVVSLEGELGLVEQGGVTRQVSFALLSEIKPGDFVLIHAGFAIERLDEEEARQTMELLREVAAAGAIGTEGGR
jgi:hydrogenase expression/formation protein HypC